MASSQLHISLYLSGSALNMDSVEGYQNYWPAWHSDYSPAATPSHQSHYSYCEYNDYTPVTSPRRTPSLTPELGEDNIWPRRSTSVPMQDPITQQLNLLRLHEKRKPLAPPEGLCDFEHPRGASYGWAALQDQYSRPDQEPSPPTETRRRRAQSSETTHCNIKYTAEELDYIRYQRVDLGHQWSLVQAKFRAMFPMVVFPEPRKTQGLQGVNYRQNKILPHIIDGQLVFMDNGHVAPICVKTRHQADKHLYTLVYLYPERAMAYPWVSATNRQFASGLNQERQQQMENARIECIRRGTYVEKLPADIPCGCCPGEDRERDKTPRDGDEESKPDVRSLL